MLVVCYNMMTAATDKQATENRTASSPVDEVVVVVRMLFVVKETNGLI